LTDSRFYAAGFSNTAADFWSTPLASAPLSTEGKGKVTRPLFCRPGEKKYDLSASWAKRAHFGIFGSFRILSNKMVEI
jgi:hypothetical protein